MEIEEGRMENRKEKMDERPHKKMDVWKNSMELAAEIYKVTKNFPKEELYGLTSQLRRAAVSVPSNLAEGAARTGPREFLQFITIAQGSLSEIDTQIELSNMLNFIDNKTFNDIQKRLIRVSKQLYGLKRSIKNKK
jgi:four helix bundle protein